MRVGTGYDLHRLVPGRPLLIGGVTIPAPFGEDGHSDGDVLIHALIDALLGAAALGDIGTHFPPGNPAFAGIDSRKLLAKTRSMIIEEGYRPMNLDATVILERPRLADFLLPIRTRLADDLELPLERVSIKAKTNEGVDAVGESRAIAVHAVVLLESL